MKAFVEIMLNNITSSTYVKQIMTLITGTLIAQIVLFAFIPIITRLYTPSDFGVYSLFFSVISIFGLVSSLKYDQAIMLPKLDKAAQSLLFLSVIITLGTGFLVSIVLLLFHDLVINYFNGLSYVVWMIPIGVLIIGLTQIFTTYSSRKQYYKNIAAVRVTSSFLTVSIQIASKSIFKLDGLIIGKLVADAVSLFLLIQYLVKKNTLRLGALSWTRLRVLILAKKYKDFPKYLSITSFLNSINQNMPVLLFTSLYSLEVAGLYALTVRVLQVPVTLIGQSTREVYYQKAARMYADGEDIFNLYLKTTLGLLKLFIFPFFIILLFGEGIFSFIFGNQWAASGTIAQLMIIWFLFTFINPPSMMTYNILKLQKIQMNIEFIALPMRILSIYAGYYFFDSYIASIIFFLISSVIINLFVILFIYFKLKKERGRL